MQDLAYYNITVILTKCVHLLVYIVVTESNARNGKCKKYQDKQCTNILTLRRVLATTVAVEKQ
jgi:hypothetical protein